MCRSSRSASSPTKRRDRCSSIACSRISTSAGDRCDAQSGPGLVSVRDHGRGIVQAMRRGSLHLSLLTLLLAGALSAAAPPPTTDAAFQKFWSAHAPDDAAKSAATIASSGVSFEDAVARLKRGRTYSTQVK